VAGKRKVEAELWIQNHEEAKVYVNTFKKAITVFDTAKLSNKHRAILDALDDEFYSLVPGAVLYSCFPFCGHYMYKSYVLMEY
jgi:hypothetical protein